MASFSEKLNQVPGLEDMSYQMRQTLLDRVYDVAKSSGKVSSEELRQFRNNQMDTLLEDERKANGETLGHGLVGGSVPLPQDREAVGKLARRNAVEDLKDFGRIVSDPVQYGAALGKAAVDISAVIPNPADTLRSVMLSQVPGFKDIPNPNEIAKKSINDWYSEVVKDDPDLAKMYHAAVVDGAIGSLFGMARAGKMAAEFGVTGLGKVREFLAPTISSVIGGQVVYHGMEGLDARLEQTDLNEGMKNGIRIAASLAAGVAVGMGPESFIERAIAADPQALKLASNLAKVSDDAKAAGKSFSEALAENPDISEDLKGQLGLTDGQNLNAPDPVAIAKQGEDVEAKTRAGVELTQEESALNRSTGATVSAPKVDTEEISEALGDMSETRKLEGEMEQAGRELDAAEKPSTDGGIDSLGIEPKAVPQKPTQSLELEMEQAGKELDAIERPSTDGGADTIVEAPEKPINVWYASNEAPQLSNLAERPFTFEGRSYRSVEHAYQSLKSGTFDAKTYGKYQKAAPGKKIKGAKADTKGNANVTLMQRLVQASFEQNPDAAKSLLDTGNSPITHTQDKGLWGKEFPRILMEVRDTLRGVPSQPKQASKAAKKYTPTEKPAQPKKPRQVNTLDNIPLERRVLTNLDELTAEQKLLASQKAATTDPAQVAELDAKLRDVEAKLTDVKNVILLELDGAGKLQSALRNEKNILEKIIPIARKQYAEAKKAGASEAELLELEANGKALVERQNLIQERLTAVEKLPKKAGKKLLDRLRAERDAKRAVKRKVEAPSAPYKEKIERTDPQTRLAELPERDRFSVLKLHNAAKMAKSDLFGRALTEEEDLDLLGTVLDKERSWGANPYEIIDKPVISAFGVSNVMAGYVHAKYPMLGRVLDVLHPHASVTGTYTPSDVFAIVQGMTIRSGFGMDEAGWLLQRELLEQSYKLWDDVKADAPWSLGLSLEDALKELHIPNVGAARAKTIADTITAAFPDLKIAYKVGGVAQAEAIAVSNNLERLITANVDETTLPILFHEIGHQHFYHGLNAAEKMAWMDDMRKSALDENSWAQNFPGYADRKVIGEAADKTPFEQARDLLWVHDPAEMYAQQFSAFLTSGRLPSIDTLTSFQKAWRGLKRVMGAAGDNWDKLPAATQEHFLRILTGPDPSEVRAVSKAEIDEALQGSWLYSDKDMAEPRVYEIRQELEATYGNRTEPMPQMVADSGEAVDPVTSIAVRPDLESAGDAPVASFFSLPTAARVAAYALDDLPKVIEMHALSLLHDLPGADYNEAVMCLRRMAQDLSEPNRGNLLDSLVARMIPTQTKYDPNYDPSVGQSYSRSELAEMGEMDAIREYNSLDAGAKNALALDATRRAKRDWHKKYAQAHQTLTEQVEAKKISSFTEADVKALADRIGSEGGNAIERQATFEYYDSQARDVMRDRYAMAAKQLASLDVYHDEVGDFLRNVLAAKGMSQPIDASFTRKMAHSAAFARAATQKGSSTFSPYQLTKLGVQLGYCAVAGLEYDPDGDPLPFFGRVRWSPTKFYDTSPLGILLIPGAYKGARWGASKAGKWAKPKVSQISKKLPPSVKSRWEDLRDTVRLGFLESGGLPSQLREATRQAQLFARTKKKDFYAFAETMSDNFSPEERAQIAKLYSREGVSVDEVMDAQANRPSIWAAVELTDRLYSSIPNTFKSIGLWSERFDDLTHYLNRYYTAFMKPQLSKVFLDSGLSPIRGDFLKRRGITDVVENGSGDVGAPGKDALIRLQENADLEGLALDEGLKLNSWRTSEGAIYYSIPDTAYDNTLKNQGLIPLHTWSDTGTGHIVERASKTRKGNLRRLKVRRDYSAEERKGMGEVVDVAVRAAAMGEALEKDLRRGKAFELIANLPDYAKRAADEAEALELSGQGWTQLEDTVNDATGLKKYGALSGMFVHPDAMLALRQMEPSRLRQTLRHIGEDNTALGIFFKGYKKALTSWKIAKTALSPIGHMNNFVSNLFMGTMQGHNMVGVLKDGAALMRLRKWSLQVRELTKKNDPQAAVLFEKLRNDPMYPTYERIRAVNIADSSQWASELSSYSLVEKLEKELANGTQTSTPMGSLFKLMSMIASPVVDTAKAGYKAATSAYENGDLIFKFGAFSQGLKQGMSDNDAVKYAYDAYFDYGNLPPVVKGIRDSGLVPFVSYIYKAIPALTKAVTQHPERVAGVALALELMHLQAIRSVYGEDDPVAVREALDEAIPDYMKSRGLGGLFRTRILNPLGSEANLQTPKGEIAKSQYVDLARMLPGADLWETVPDKVNDIDFSLMAPGNLIYRTLLQNPLIANAVMAGTGKNPQLGFSLNDGGEIDSPAVAQRKEAGYAASVWNTVVPNLPFLPGTPTADKIREALSARGMPDLGWWGGDEDLTGLDSVGMPKSLGAAVANTIGVKFRDVYPEQSLYMQQKSAERELGKEKSRLRRIFKSPAKSDDYKQEQLEDYQQTAQYVQEGSKKRSEMMQRLTAARRRAQGGQSLPH